MNPSVKNTKTAFSHITGAFNVINVPAVVVMKNGKESVRAGEYKKYGMAEKGIACYRA